MAWTKLKDRQVYDFAVVSVAVAFTVDGAGKWADGRVVLGGVSPVPYRAAVVENALKGQDVKATARQAASQIRTVARPAGSRTVATPSIRTGTSRSRAARRIT